MPEEFVGLPEQAPIPNQGDGTDYVAVPRDVLQGMLDKAAGLQEQVTSLSEEVANLRETLGALLLNGANVEPPAATNAPSLPVKASTQVCTGEYKIVPPILPTREDTEAEANYEAHAARDSLRQTLDEVMQALQISASIALDNPPKEAVLTNPPKKSLLRPSRTTPVGPEKASWKVPHKGHVYGFSMERTQTGGEKKEIRRFSMTKYSNDPNSHFAVALDMPRPDTRRLTLGWNFDWSNRSTSEMEKLIGELLPDTTDMQEGAKLFEKLKHGNHNLTVTFKPHDDGGVELSLNSPKSSARAQSLAYNLQDRCFQNRSNNPYGHSYYAQDIPAEAARQLIEMTHKLVPSL